MNKKDYTNKLSCVWFPKIDILDLQKNNSQKRRIFAPCIHQTINKRPEQYGFGKILSVQTR